MKSGTAHAEWSFKSAEVASYAAFMFGNVMNCSATTSGELFTCLRGKTADEIINYFNEVRENGFYKGPCNFSWILSTIAPPPQKKKEKKKEKKG